MGAALEFRGEARTPSPPEGLRSSRSENARPSCNGPRPRLRCLLDTRPRAEPSARLPSPRFIAGEGPRSIETHVARPASQYAGRTSLFSTVRLRLLGAGRGRHPRRPRPLARRQGRPPPGEPSLFDNPVVGRYTNSSRESRRRGPSGSRRREDRDGIRHEPFPGRPRSGRFGGLVGVREGEGRVAYSTHSFTPPRRETPR